MAPLFTNDADLDDRYTPIQTFEQWSTGIASDEQNIEQVSQTITSLRTTLGESRIQEALANTLDAAALETGAMEGLYPPTVGLTLSVLNGVINFEAVKRKIEDETQQRLIQGQRLAYDLALDVMARQQPFSEALLRELHAKVCSFQDFYTVHTELDGQIVSQQQKLPKGVYKSQSNHVMLADGSVHNYAPVLETPNEMQRFVSELQKEDFRQSPAILQSAYIHHCLTHIHPFADGNGRTARLVASIPLLAKWSVPLVIFSDDASDYFAVQNKADKGDNQPFVAFLNTITFDLLSIIVGRLRLTAAEDASTMSTANASDLVNSYKDAATEIETAATRLDSLLAATLAKKCEQFNADTSVVVTLLNSSVVRVSLAGYRPSGQGFTVQMFLDGVSASTIVNNIQVNIADSDDALQILLQSKSQPGLAVSPDRVYPRPKQMLKVQLETWIDEMLLSMRNILHEKLL